MAPHISPAGALPAGWTYHALNGRPFYYHAATNTTRSDPPMVTGSFEMNQYSSDAPQYPEPASEPQPPLTNQSELQGQLQAMCAAAQAQPPAPQPPVVVPAAVVAYAAATTPYATATSPHVQAMTPLPPALQLQPGIYAGVQAPQMPMAAPVPMFAAPVAQPQQMAQQMAQLQVIVPEPGLRAGQQLAFSAPAAGPGLQPLPMTVTVNQEVVAGSIVSVQYPRPQMFAQPGQPVFGQSLPATSVHVDPAEDQRQSHILWALYGAGCCCSLIFGPFALILWVVGCSVHFCKPAATRAQYPRARTPAMFAAATCGLFLCCGLLMIPIALMSPGFKDAMEHKFHHHHHGPPPPWGPHHHGPPWGAMGMGHGSVSRGHEADKKDWSTQLAIAIIKEEATAYKESDIAKWVESPHSQGPLMTMTESRVMPPRPLGPMMTPDLDKKMSDLQKSVKITDLDKWAEAPRPQPPVIAGQYIVL